MKTVCGRPCKDPSTCSQFSSKFGTDYPAQYSGFPPRHSLPCPGNLTTLRLRLPRCTKDGYNHGHFPRQAVQEPNPWLLIELRSPYDHQHSDEVTRNTIIWVSGYSVDADSATLDFSLSRYPVLELNTTASSLDLKSSYGSDG